MEQHLNPIERTYRRLVATGKNPLKLFSGNPNEHGIRFPEAPLLQCYERYFKNQDYRPHPKGLKAARQAVAAYYETQGAAVDPENILLTSGTSEALFYLFSLLTTPGENILAPSPAYPLFEHIAQLTHTRLRSYPLQEAQAWDVDLAALQELADAETRALLLVSPNNPTGAVTGAEQIREITAWCNQKGIALICDEVFSEFYFRTGPFPRAVAVSRPDLCFTLNGISKMFALPALKLGWIGVTGKKDGVESAVDRLETMADTFLSCHIPIQQALPALFSEGRAFVESYRQEVLHRRNLAVELLRDCPHVSFVEPAGGFYLTAKVEKDLKCSEEEWVIRLMEKKNVFVHPGYFFDYEQGVHFVVSFLTHPEKLQAGIQAIAEFLE
jgi:aspartate/methionine/tyrosine aminotransferase